MKNNSIGDIGAAGPEGCISTVWLGLICLILMGIITAGVFSTYGAITQKMAEVSSLPDAGDPMPEGWYIIDAPDGSGGRVSTRLLDGIAFAFVVILTVVLFVVSLQRWGSR